MNEADSFRVACPECGKRLRVKAALSGKRLKCPACSHSFKGEPSKPQSPPSKMPAPPKKPGAAAAGQDAGKILGVSSDRFMELIEEMGARQKKDRMKNWIVKVLRGFQVLAVILLVIGLIGVKVSDRGDEKLMGLAVAGAGLIGILIVEGIARGMGRLK